MVPSSHGSPARRLLQRLCTGWFAKGFACLSHWFLLPPSLLQEPPDTYPGQETPQEMAPKDHQVFYVNPLYNAGEMETDSVASCWEQPPTPWTHPHRSSPHSPHAMLGSKSQADSS